MTEMPDETAEADVIPQINFEQVSTLVSAEFQIEEALVEHSVPTYYLKYPQETKKAFLRLLKKLDEMNLVAVLRRVDKRIVLRVIPKPPKGRSNILVNWLLFFATIGTTFLTGYMLSGNLIDPLIGGATFTIAIMAVLGLHEMGHKLTANKSGIDATPPYFIPGPPPLGGFLGIGTFGAVIMQRSLPPNKDSLFDVGASGPIFGFFIALIATLVGLPFSTYKWVPADAQGLPVPLVFSLLTLFLHPIGAAPPSPGPEYRLGIVPHPVAFAGWVGIVITMLNLLPAAMLDGGHISRSLFGEKTRLVLTTVSILSLIFFSFPMAIFVLFMSTQKHPGPLDDVSSLSTSRKLLSIVLLVVFVLSSFLHYLVYLLLALLQG